MMRMKKGRLRPLAPLDGCATMYKGFLYEYQNFVALGACRPEDCTCRLTTYCSVLVAVSARGPEILHDKMHVISGRGEKTRHLVSEIKEHIARASAKIKS